MRMFVAVVPPAQALEDLEEFLEPRRAADPALRWSTSDQWHLTLAFMAAVPDRNLDGLLERLEHAAARRTPFELALAGGGAFPDPARAKVLYAAVRAPAPGDGPTGQGDGAGTELDRLARGARAAAATAGTEVDGTRFHPHVTLARAGRPTQVTRWLRVLDAYRGPTWPVEEVVLVGSHLGEGPRGRPRHEEVAAFRLGG
jgi:2'-5' RNA ligase